MSNVKRGRGRPKQDFVNWKTRPDIEYVTDKKTGIKRKNLAYNAEMKKKKNISKTIIVDNDPKEELLNEYQEILSITEGNHDLLTEEEENKIKKYVLHGINSSYKNAPHHHMSLETAYGDDGGKHWYKPSGDQRRESSIGFIENYGYYPPILEEYEDTPTKISTSGEITWENEQGKLHRDNGPAKQSSKIVGYYQNGVPHRDDGPAIIKNNGEKTWYENGVITKTISSFGTVKEYDNGVLTNYYNPTDPKIQEAIDREKNYAKEENERKQKHQELLAKQQAEKQEKLTNRLLEIKKYIDDRDGYLIRDILYRNGVPISAKQKDVTDNYGKTRKAYQDSYGRHIFTSSAKDPNVRASNNAKKKLEIKREKIKTKVDMRASNEFDAVKFDLLDIKPLEDN